MRGEQRKMNLDIDKELKKCRLCPRVCGVDRTAGCRGFCGAGRSARIARAALHYWEEPCISGKNGSGTVFFSGCTMRCIYCQNYELSAKNFGYDITERELARKFLMLQGQGAENINLVTPTQYIPHIINSVCDARKNGLSIPVVYNTGGYETERSLELLEGTVDVYLPDFKYFNDKLAAKYSSAAGYTRIVKNALDIMFEQVGEPIFDGNGMMIKGMIIRHLMLPGHLDDTARIINYISKRFGNSVYFSLMSQYTPVRKIKGHPDLNRTVEKKYYDFAVSICEDLGMENVFIQEGSSVGESFIPEFTGNYEHPV